MAALMKYRDVVEFAGLVFFAVSISKNDVPFVFAYARQSKILESQFVFSPAGKVGLGAIESICVIHATAKILANQKRRPRA